MTDFKAGYAVAFFINIKSAKLVHLY